MSRRIAILLLVVMLAVPQPALTCQIRRFGNAKPTCLCRGDRGRWRAWPMVACLVRR